MRGLLLALLLAVPAAAQLYPPSWKPISVSKWGGLNLLNDTTMIDGDCQDCQNVLTDNSYLEKRPGNVLLKTILAGYGVTYVNDWTAPSGSRYLIAQASGTIYQTNFSGAPVALSTIAAGYNLTMTPAFSKAYFADGARALWYWDGTSTATATDPTSGAAAPICTYTVFKDNRIFCGNIPNASSSQVDVSSSGGANYWQVPADAASVDNAPNSFLFTPDDGDYITCMAATPWGVFVGKRYSSYMIKGNGNLSYDPRILDPRIGCVDNRSVQVDYGVLKWLSIDGVYGYDGAGPPHILTRELDPLMKKIRQGQTSEGQWATQLQPDWASGTTSSTTYPTPPADWNFTSVPGEIFPSSFTLHDDNTNPSLQTNGKVGFSSDTLVNIDTQTYPLDIGVAQVLPSSTGVQVWMSSFPSGGYSALYTTWTVTSGAFDLATANLYFPELGNNILAPDGVLYYPAGTNTLYTVAASSSGSPTSGWNYGFWSIVWEPGYELNGSKTYGKCAVLNGDVCFEYDFISDRPVEGAWTGYGVSATQSSCSGTSCTYSFSLIKSVAGSKTAFANASANITTNSSSVVFSTVSVSLAPGGQFIIYLGTSPIVHGYDSGASGKIAKISSLSLNLDTCLNKPCNEYGINTAANLNLKGYGSGSIVSRIYDSGLTTPLPGIFLSSYTLQGVTGISTPETELDFYVRASSSPNNDLWTAWQASSNNVVVTSLNKRYWQYEALFTSRVASATVQLGTVDLVGVATGYYYSKVNFVGANITAWKQFAVTEGTPGTYGYSVRAATYAFAAGATSPTWTSQSANQNISIATGSYAQFRLDSTALSNASLAEPISAVFLRWQTGANIPVASAALDRRYYLCVTISTSASTPDTCLVHQRNGKWVFWKGPTVGAMGLYNYNVVVADGGTSSKVWEIMQPGVYSDDGTAIDAYWISADFTDGVVFLGKTVHEMWVDAAPVALSSVTVSYQINKNPGWNDVTVNLDNGTAPLPSALPVINPQYGDVNKWIPLNAGIAVGKYIRVRFGDNQLDDFFRINAYQILVEDNSRTVP